MKPSVVPPSHEHKGIDGLSFQQMSVTFNLCSIFHRAYIAIKAIATKSSCPSSSSEREACSPLLAERTDLACVCRVACALLHGGLLTFPYILDTLSKHFFLLLTRSKATIFLLKMNWRRSGTLFLQSVSPRSPGLRQGTEQETLSLAKFLSVFYCLRQLLRQGLRKE